MYQLDILVQHCDALLLAEVAGWVHNWDKCIDMKLASDWKKGSRVDQNKIHQWQQRGSSLSPGNFASCLQNLNLNLCASQGDLKTIAEIGREPSKAKQSGNLLAKALGKSHDAAHVEKELGDQENVSLATDWLSSPFDGKMSSLITCLCASWTSRHRLFKDLPPKQERPSYCAKRSFPKHGATRAVQSTKSRSGTGLRLSRRCTGRNWLAAFSPAIAVNITILPGASSVFASMVWITCSASPASPTCWRAGHC